MAIADRLARLFRGDAPGDAEASARIVVVDTETTGLDAAKDALVAIGGVAVDDEGVDPADSFDVVQFLTKKLSVSLGSVETIVHFGGDDSDHLALRAAQRRRTLHKRAIEGTQRN